MTRPVPVLKSQNDVLIRVAYAGLNPVDAKHVVGDKLPTEWMREWMKKHVLRNKIIGFDFAGTVIDDLSGCFHPGDEVFGTVPPFVGTCAEYILAPRDQIYYKPRPLNMAQAASLPLVGLTCYQCLQPHVQTDSNVLVIGASGGTGHMAVRITQCLGASNVTAVCSKKNHALLTRLGATNVIDYHDDEFLQQLAQHGPYSVVLDAVTSADPRDQAMHNYPRLLQNPNTHLVTQDYVYRRLGGPPGDWIRAGLQRTAGLECWKNRHEQLFWIKLPQSAPQLHILHDWVDEGKLTPHIQQEYTLENIVDQAFEAIRSRRVTGKLVVRI